MPTKGSFKVELIEATTKSPFKEHPGRNGMESYFEVEPGLEYFIQVTNGSDETVFSTYKVDGVKLNHKSTLKPHTTKEEGLWTYDAFSSSSSTKALRFHKAFVCNSRNIHEYDKDYDNNEVGVIEVSFFEKIYLDGYYYVSSSRRDCKYFGGGTAEVNVEHVGVSKKFLKSEVGCTETKKHDDGRRKKFRVGANLQTIKIKYCSTVGLIVDGVLSKPPMWDYFKMVKPHLAAECADGPSHHQQQTLLAVEPSRHTHIVYDTDGNVLSTKEYEMFDLTAT